MKISTITLAETEEIFVFKFKILLKKSGINTQKFKHFKTSEDALDFYKSPLKETSICFIDVNLKGMISVVDLISKLKNIVNGLQIGIISNSGGIVAHNVAKSAGANFFMSKEGNYDEMEKKINQFKFDFMINDPQEKFYIYE